MTANQELNQINDYWFLENKLFVNIENIYIYIYTCHKSIVKDNINVKLPSLQLNGYTIERENSFKVSWCYPWWTFSLEETYATYWK